MATALKPKPQNEAIYTLQGRISSIKSDLSYIDHDSKIKKEEYESFEKRQVAKRKQQVSMLNQLNRALNLVKRSVK